MRLKIIIERGKFVVHIHLSFLTHTWSMEKFSWKMLKTKELQSWQKSINHTTTHHQILFSNFQCLCWWLVSLLLLRVFFSPLPPFFSWCGFVWKCFSTPKLNQKPEIHLMDFSYFNLDDFTFGLIEIYWKLMCVYWFWQNIRNTRNGYYSLFLLLVLFCCFILSLCLWRKTSDK